MVWCFMEVICFALMNLQDADAMVLSLGTEHLLRRSAGLAARYVNPRLRRHRLGLLNAAGLQ